MLEQDAARVRAEGELDTATVPILQAELTAARNAGFRRLSSTFAGSCEARLPFIRP